jgi:hypothetical protein
MCQYLNDPVRRGYRFDRVRAQFRYCWNEARRGRKTAWLPRRVSYLTPRSITSRCE